MHPDPSDAGPDDADDNVIPFPAPAPRLVPDAPPLAELPPPVEPDPLAAAFTEPSPQQPPNPDPQLVLTCPCGEHHMALQIPFGEWSREPKRFVSAAASQLAMLFLDHLTTLGERAAAYDKIPIKDRINLPTRDELIVEYGDRKPCALRQAALAKAQP